MSRYIDADSLIGTLYIQADNDGFICCGVEDLEALINTQPTADVVEVVRGEWQVCDAPPPTWWYECSICGSAGNKEYNFCKNCGADMRGDKDE